MSGDAGGAESAWTDPDDAPAWTDAMFARAAIMDGDRVLRPGLGRVSHGYVDGSLDIGGPDGSRRVTIDVDRAVYERFLADGPGWEARMADALKRTVGQR